MKKIFLVAAGFLAGTSFGFSQNANNDGPKLLNKLKITCQLTSEQMRKLQPVVEKHVEALQADKQKFAGSELRKADDSENVRFDELLKGILTTTQMESYKSME